MLALAGCNSSSPGTTSGGGGSGTGTGGGASWKLDQCTDASCILTADAPADGPRTDNYLSSDSAGTPIDGGEKGGGHGQFIVNWIRQ